MRETGPPQVLRRAENPAVSVFCAVALRAHAAPARRGRRRRGKDYIGSRGSTCMVSSGRADIDILHRAVSGGGCIGEAEIGRSALGKMGTGQALDHLASMIERNLLSSEGGGRFCITEDARLSLWSSGIPALGAHTPRAADVPAHPGRDRRLPWRACGARGR